MVQTGFMSMTTKFFKVEGVVRELGFIRSEEGCNLLLSKKDYEAKTTNLVFPQEFMDQETSIEYKLYDVTELDAKTIVATYELV